MKKELYLLIGQRIKSVRLSKGLKQEDLANKLKPKKTAASISNTEKGAQRIYVDFLYDVADVLGVEVQTFFPTLQQLQNSIPSIEKELEKFPTKEQKLVKELRGRKLDSKEKED